MNLIIAGGADSKMAAHEHFSIESVTYSTDQSVPKAQHITSGNNRKAIPLLVPRNAKGGHGAITIG